MPGALATRRAAAETVREEPEIGLRDRKKARLRRQIIDTSIKLFRKHGYENTRIDDIVQTLEISQPTFFRYFPSKDAVLREVGERGYTCICERLRSELSSSARTRERLRRLYVSMAREVEADRPLWQAVVLSGAMDPVRTAELRGHEEAAVSLLREILTQGQKRGEVTRAFPVVHLAEFMEGLYNTVVRQMGGGFERAAQACRPSAERGGIFLAWHPAVRFPRSHLFNVWASLLEGETR